MSRDVLNRLAEARPPQLDPADDPARRERDLDRAFAAAQERTVRSIARPARWTALVLGVAAAGAAAAVAIAATGQGSPETPPSVDLNKQAVLAAAEKAALVPTGKYWYSNQIQGQSYIMRPKTGTYAIVGAHTETFEWSGAKSGTGEAFYGRDIPSRPLTPKDEELWRKAGAPSKFRVWSNDHYYTYDHHSSSWEVDDPDPKGGGTFLGDMTVEKLQNLPTDPASLAAMFFKDLPSRDRSTDGPDLKGVQERLVQFEKQPVPEDPQARAKREENIKVLRAQVLEMQRRMKENPPNVAAADLARAKVMRVEDLMMGAPLSPAVRAGLMRALAAQPGVKAIGSVTDSLGRKGVALAAADTPTRIDGEYGAPAAEQGSFESREEILFDPKTGQLLGSRRVLTRPGGAYKAQAPGFVINYWLVRDSGWTDTKPKPPAKLPF
ncbi:hypothetical protein [Spirillospora sp. CA-128828]|uniref:hypothetical protein n=1 Tax=Spirillospora sp. CA-128828 TaxID=3240033 RepID=UPI003D930136